MMKTRNLTYLLVLASFIFSLNLVSAVSCTDVGATTNGLCNVVNSDGNFIITIINGVYDTIIIVSPLLPIIFIFFLMATFILLIVFIVAFFRR